MIRLLPLLVLVLAVAVAVAEPPGVLSGRPGARVLPLPKSEDAFHFVIFGDRTGGPASGIQILSRAVRDTNLLDPDLVMTVGDLIQGYVDGRQVAAARAHGTRRRNRLPLYVGADPDARGTPTSTIDGAVDEVRISRGARYADASFEPATRFEADPDTLLLLHLDRAVGSFALDSGPGRRHPVCHGRLVIEPRGSAGEE
jgi:hypothetical protein